MLDLGIVLDGLDASITMESYLRGQPFNAIGSLPNLETFGIDTVRPVVLASLAGAIGCWTIVRFELRCESNMQVHTNTPLDNTSRWEG